MNAWLRRVLVSEAMCALMFLVIFLGNQPAGRERALRAGLYGAAILQLGLVMTWGMRLFEERRRSGQGSNGGRPQ